MVIGDKYPIAYVYIIKRLLILEPWMNTLHSHLRLEHIAVLYPILGHLFDNAAFAELCVEQIV